MRRRAFITLPRCPRHVRCTLNRCHDVAAHTYGATFTDELRTAGRYAGRILAGEKPNNLPILQPSLNFHRLLDGQIAGLGSLENFSGIDADLTIRIGKNGSIAYQAAGHRKVAPLVHRRHCMAGGERDDLIRPAVEKRPEAA